MTTCRPAWMYMCPLSSQPPRCKTPSMMDLHQPAKYRLVDDPVIVSSKSSSSCRILPESQRHCVGSYPEKHTPNRNDNRYELCTCDNNIVKTAARMATAGAIGGVAVASPAAAGILGGVAVAPPATAGIFGGFGFGSGSVGVTAGASLSLAKLTLC